MITRRTIICAAAAAATAATTPPVIAATETDPIFNIIERHRAAFAEFVAASMATDRVLAKEDGREVNQAAEDRLDAAADADIEMSELLAATAPTTLVGLAVAVSWLAEYDGCCLPDTSGQFLRTLAKSDLLNI